MDTMEMDFFQCGMCQRKYKRLDHLSRHVRTHAQSKPYECRYCSRSFTRRDLLKRHTATHESQPGRPEKPPSRALRSTPARVTQACKACSANHLRCCEEKPCRRCNEKGLECIWTASIDVTSTMTPPATDTELDPRQSPQVELQHDNMSPTRRPGQTRQEFGSPSVDGQSTVLASSVVMSDSQVQDSMVVSQSGTSGYEMPLIDFLPGRWSNPNGGLNLGWDGSIDLDDTDIFSLNAYNSGVPFEPWAGPTPLPQQEPVLADLAEAAAMSTVASSWTYRPNPKDHVSAEEHNLSLSADDASPESRVSLESRCCLPDNLPRAVTSFPSKELLDVLVQYWLTAPTTRANSFLHIATFDPTQARTELVAAMAASGAVLTNDPALVKLGFAIFECLKTAIPNLWNRNNALVRDLQLGQAFLITLEAGLWSGYSRKTEIAESFLYPLLTMLRRGRKFRAPVRTDQGGSDEASISMRQQWLTWVENESFKRLVFRLLIHDTNTSMAMLVNPLVSYAEVQLPVPESSEAWTASNEDAWTTAVEKQGDLHNLSIPDFFDDPALLASHSDSVDVPLVVLAVLSCVWGLAWEYIQLSSFQRRRPRRWNALVMTTRLDELLKLMSQLRDLLGSRVSVAPYILMKLELIHLHLHMPFEDIQTFAGLEGLEQARAVGPVVHAWIQGKEARQAICHAGQILRAARQLGKGPIRDFDAFMVYHASLALWIYGFLWARHVSANTLWSGIVQDVVLDGDTSIALHRFTDFGEGRPCISQASRLENGERNIEILPLSQPDKVMEAVIGIVEANFGGREMPHLTKKLVQLMTELQKCSARAAAAAAS